MATTPPPDQITKGNMQLFPVVKPFSASTAAGAADAANNFITGTLNVDTVNFYQVMAMQCYFDGSQHVVVLLYSSYVIITDTENSAT